MKRWTWMFVLVILIMMLSACNDDSEKDTSQDTEELKTLAVEFEVPEKASVGETVELKATVTYGDEIVNDADEVSFEYWLQENEDDSTTIEAINNEDGTYTAEVSFATDGVYEIYAHTTARDLHTMPKESITVGEGIAAGEEHQHEEGHEHSSHTEGFGMHFVQPEDVQVNEEINLTVHLEMDNEPLEEARVRYEIYQEDSETPDWVDTKESVSGEYSSSYSFEQEGVYTVVIHVQNNEGLHEHTEKQIEVNK
ncbi:FixH family protein [Paucisalibacillus globulus]|uniref:FixH family protein n=1 Tax=Paucisalibacillus globulus TaxID=351095 RepID=UPI000BB758E3|nr:FixH family protein [Paucisalibacillus globulus]